MITVRARTRTLSFWKGLSIGCLLGECSMVEVMSSRISQALRAEEAKAIYVIFIGFRARVRSKHPPLLEKLCRDFWRVWVMFLFTLCSSIDSWLRKVFGLVSVSIGSEDPVNCSLALKGRWGFEGPSLSCDNDLRILRILKSLKQRASHNRTAQLEDVAPLPLARDRVARWYAYKSRYEITTLSMLDVG